MDRLSSCFFCGAAVDAPLEEYPLVGSDDGDGVVVTLCPTCHRKLTTILDRVGGATHEPATAASSDVAGEGEPATDASLDEDVDASLDPPDEGDDAELLEDQPTSMSDPPTHDPEAAGDDALDDAAVSVLEYNRVMRLLENRALPVERVAFRELATSAYELSPSTVDAVLDAAIDGGLLEEDDEGRLVRAPDREPDDDTADGDGEPPA